MESGERNRKTEYTCVCNSEHVEIGLYMLTRSFCKREILEIDERIGPVAYGVCIYVSSRGFVLVDFFDIEYECFFCFFDSDPASRFDVGHLHICT